MTEMTLRMYLRQHGQQHGPFDADDVRQRYDTGELGVEVLSWHRGEPRWQSLGRRWPRVGQLRLVRQWPACLIGVLFTSAAVTMAFPSWSFRVLPFVAQRADILWLLECVFVALAATAVAITAWRMHRQRQSPNVLFVTVAISVVLGAAVGLSLTKVAAPFLAFRLNHSNAQVYFDAGLHDIVIKGAIGARFSKDLSTVISAHPDAQKILIRSQGGFVDDAFRAADVITAARLPLEVVNYCASACVVLWAKVPQREMASGAHLGLHQNRFEYNFDPAMVSKSKDQLDVRTDEALAQAGFSQHLQYERSVTPPEKVFWVSVPDAKHEGVAFQLVAGPPRSNVF